MWAVLSQFKSVLFVLRLIAVALLLNACSSTSRLGFSPLSLPPLQLDEGELSPSSALASVENYQLLTVSPEMIRYFDRYVSRSMPAQQRARMIHRVLSSPAFLAVEYERSKTLTAEQVFFSGAANCLGFANAYIALARQYGLNARYQLLEKHPEWTVQGEQIALEIHVNSLVRLRNAGELTVDIDRPGSRQAGRPAKVSDEVAKALFYNNLAIDQFSQGDQPGAYRLLVKAIQLAPDNAMLWSNLGVIYRNNQQYQHAENAYHNSLQLDPDTHTAITNLAALYQHTGQTEKYAKYFEKMSQLRLQNPYYHYYLARQAEQDNDYSTAINHINRAIKIKKDEADFAALLDQLYRQSRQLASSAAID
jgi:Flp pilus assembly protein TadD